MGKNKTKIIPQLSEDEFLNAYTTIDYFTRLKEYALNTFEWINLPNHINGRFIEIELFEKGKICFFKDKNLGEMCLPVNEDGELTIYNEYKTKRIDAVNGFRRTRNLKNSVVIYNNYLRTPTFTTINLYAIRLSQVTRTIDVNIKAMKTPIIVLAPENQKLALKNVILQNENNASTIYADSEFNLDAIKTLDLKVPYNVDKLTLYKHELWNEVMTFLGVDNANQDKKERMITGEVDSNDEQIEQARFNMLDSRLDACKRINEMFGTNISCKFRNDKVQKAYEQAKIIDLFPELTNENIDEKIEGDVIE